MTERTGTKEWSDYSLNIFRGCAHACRYCYARHEALRFGRIAKPEEWTDMVSNENGLNQRPRKLKGRIMAPTTHDILPEHALMFTGYLKGWLEVGNEMLIVIKPHAAVILALCASLKKYRGQLTFRFTIGSPNNQVLKFWEPGAPSFEERIACLKWAHHEGYKTSVSCEPFLDAFVDDLVREVDPYITDTIWIGLMNQIKQRVDIRNWQAHELAYLAILRGIYDPVYIRPLYNRLKDNPKIRWKDSIKKMLGLPGEEIG